VKKGMASCLYARKPLSFLLYGVCAEQTGWAGGKKKGGFVLNEKKPLLRRKGWVQGKRKRKAVKGQGGICTSARGA